jgi:ATP-dependent Lon protease
VKSMTEVRNAAGEPKGGDLSRFPLLPLRDMVVFPFMVVPLYVGREKSVLALEAAMAGGREIFLATQMDPHLEEPDPQGIHPWGSVCAILQILKLPDGTVKALLEGKRRARVISYLDFPDYLMVEVVEMPDDSVVTPEIEALMRRVRDAFARYAKLATAVTDEAAATVAGIDEPGRLSDVVAPHLGAKSDMKQELLAMVELVPRLELLLDILEGEIEVINLEKKIQSRVKKQVEKNQKDYYLNEQMRAIRKELGDKDDGRQELQELEERVVRAKLSKEARNKAGEELKKLKLMSPLSAEAAVVRNYIDWLVALPWSKVSREKHDIRGAEEVLNRDHYGLEKVKERILEYLSVLSLVRKIRGPILCLVGPPGVGKTSLARSVAEATGRKFVKMSLGGMRDEAEIRGHRRTYIGAMPGKIIQNLKKAGTNNPLFLMDEIDKMSSDFRGDPASALLEVLDPEQNRCFSDHFLDVEYDLSQVMFFTTANSLHSIPRPLLDRMEIIQLSGYTEPEKLNIARNYLIPKQRELHGLTPGQLVVDDDAVLEILRHYTREAGVRNLERELAAVCRKRVHELALGKNPAGEVTAHDVRRFLGVARYSVGRTDDHDAIGLVNGLAWTEAGGELLSVEVTILPGKGNLTVTGKLGEVMQESARAALSYVRSRGELLGLERDFYQSVDLHVHVPEGAIPKDGPSAGITMATAMVSALTRTPVHGHLAMTGEITLRGRVLPIGGLKEKILAAKRGGVTTVLIPRENEKDLAELSREIRDGVTIHTVAHMDEVLSYALVVSVPVLEPQVPTLMTRPESDSLVTH